MARLTQAKKEAPPAEVVPEVTAEDEVRAATDAEVEARLELDAAKAIADDLEAQAETTDGPTSAPEPADAGKPATKPLKRASGRKEGSTTPASGSGDDWDLGTPLSDAEELVNGLWYGKEGTGKTTDVMYLANLGRTVVINAEAGIKRRRLQQLGVNVDNIRVWPDTSRGEQLTFDGLEALFWKLQGQLVDDPTSWAGVIWDSLTEIHKMLLDRVVDSAFRKATDNNKNRERFFIDRADYGVMTEQVRLLLRRFRDLPCHFAVTALERRDQDDDGKVIYSPAVNPALLTDVPGFFDMVIHTDVMELDGEEVFVGQTRKVGKYRAKDRWYATPRYMVDPTFERVVLYITEELEPDTDPKQLEMRQRQQALASAEAAKAS